MGVRKDLNQAKARGGLTDDKWAILSLVTLALLAQARAAESTTS